MSKNSHQIFKVPNEDLFLRIYKHGDFLKPLDNDLPKNTQFKENLLNIIEISTT